MLAHVAPSRHIPALFDVLCDAPLVDLLQSFVPCCGARGDSVLPRARDSHNLLFPPATSPADWALDKPGRSADVSRPVASLPWRPSQIKAWGGWPRRIDFSDHCASASTVRQVGGQQFALVATSNFFFFSSKAATLA